jgi:hypothetical protein
VRLLRRITLVLLALFALVGVVYGAVKSYLSSDRVAAEVVARLQTIYGGTVQVDAVDIGMDQTTLHGLRFLEADAPADESPWLTIDELEIDQGAWEWSWNKGPAQELTANGCTIRLSFNADGHLKTRLPAARKESTTWPRINLSNVTLTLQQEDRPDMVTHGIDVVLEAGPDDMVLQGSVADPFWGDWQVSGHVAPPTLTGWLGLKAERTRVTMDKLRGLPFVPATVWHEVQTEGDASVDYRLQFDLKARTFHYCVEAHPESNKIHVDIISLDAEETSGQVVVEDGTVTLTDLKGHSAGGQIDLTRGVLKCRQVPKEMEFDVSVTRLELQALPPSWRRKVPLGMKGFLTGRAEIQLMLTKPKTRYSGKGEGAIYEARLLGAPPFPKPFDLVLSDDGEGGLHIRPANPTGR